MKQLPKINELWWIKTGIKDDNTAILKVVKSIGDSDLVVLKSYNAPYVEIVRWSMLVNPVKATPTLFQRLLGYK
jgi:hypothetical protein